MIACAMLHPKGLPGAEPGSSNSDLQDQPPELSYETRTVCGWTLHINRKLLAANARETTKVLELLDQQLDAIVQSVPKAAVTKLQQVPLYFNPEYAGVRPTAEYH